MSFLDDIFAKLATADEEDRFLTELCDPDSTKRPVNWSVGGRGLLMSIARAREFLSTRNLHQGDRVALLAANGIDWIALNLAIMAEGLVVVPLYSRQAPPELVAMMKDC